MDINSYEKYQAAMRRRHLINLAALALLAAVMAGLWFLGSEGLTADERALWTTVRRAETDLWRWRVNNDRGYDQAADPYRTGLIGVEWSPLSTTMGALEAKRTACDPRFAVLLYRWLGRAGVGRGDTVVLLSSSSFPGLILNAAAALEARGARVISIVSLGSSTWGANEPGFAWPQLSARLRKRGYIRLKADYYTLGGNGEIGGGLSPEGRALMEQEAKADGVPLVVKKDLAAMIDWKLSVIEKAKPRLVINIGGSHANLGADDDVSGLAPGYLSGTTPHAGSGVVGRALAKGWPVVHLLNVKKLCVDEGIPFDSKPASVFRSRRTLACGAAALVLFAAALCWFKRWRFLE